MGEIDIQTGNVNDVSTQIRNLNAAIYDLLQKMKNDMNSLQGTWISDGSEEIRSRFNTMANRFETQKQIIDSYAGHLELVAENYDTLESVITGNASSMDV